MSLKILNLFDMMNLIEEHGLQVHGAPARGLPLHSNGHLGADILQVKAGEQFPVHTHPGDHLLYCLSGHGTITVDKIVYEVKRGDLYMVNGLVPHAVGALTDHVLIAIGAPHKPVDSPERMTFVDWEGNCIPSSAIATSAAAQVGPRDDLIHLRSNDG